MGLENNNLNDGMLDDENIELIDLDNDSGNRKSCVSFVVEVENDEGDLKEPEQEKRVFDWNNLRK